MAVRICGTCLGRGRVKCPKCDGEGKINVGEYVDVWETCPKCKGEKEIKCPEGCKGGYIRV